MEIISLEDKASLEIVLKMNSDMNEQAKLLEIALSEFLQSNKDLNNKCDAMMYSTEKFQSDSEAQMIEVQEELVAAKASFEIMLSKAVNSQKEMGKTAELCLADAKAKADQLVNSGREFTRVNNLLAESQAEIQGLTSLSDSSIAKMEKLEKTNTYQLRRIQSMQKSLPRNIQTQYGEYSIPYVVMPDVITGFVYESGLYFYGLWAYDCCKNI